MNRRRCGICGHPAPAGIRMQDAPAHHAPGCRNAHVRRHGRHPL